MAINKIKEIGSRFRQLYLLFHAQDKNDACETFDDYLNLDFDMREKVKDFITYMPSEINITCNGQPFVLLHAGVNQMGITDLYIRDKFYTMDTNTIHPSGNKHREGSIYIFGHTTTKHIRINVDHVLQHPPTIWRQDKKIGIDCGAPYEHGRLACLRLDDMAEFYVDNKRRMHLPVSKINELVKKCTPQAD